jgi:ATP-dependent helicase HrpA
MAASPYRTTEALVEDLQLAAVTALTCGDAAGPGTPVGPDAATIESKESFEEASAFIRAHLEDEVYRVAGHVVAALAAYRELEREVKQSSSLALLNTLQDIRDHAAGLVHDGFVAATPPRRLPMLVRYLRADAARLDKARTSPPARDEELSWRIEQVEQAYASARTAYAQGRPSPERAATLAEVRWQIEELRVSLFAQQLGTDGPISEQRIRKALAGK